ncbi:hypothetical protein H3V53_10520 [Paraburkholderia bengalensis]|uniref:Four helix bundle protein n=1 Tax=Paraburkholderia bengalensis TaxID=2747562 RepID=A0ABU8IPS9_9BURK
MKSDKNLLYIDAELRTFVLEVVRVLCPTRNCEYASTTCEDLAGQLSANASWNIATAGMSRDVALSRAEEGVRAKVDAAEWDFSRSEVAWVLNRSRGLMQMGDDGKAQIS